MTKDSIRKEMLASRDVMNPMITNMLSNTIVYNLEKVEEFYNSDIVFLYSSIRNEVDTVEIIEYCFKNNIKVALPCSYMSNGAPKMDFYYINSRTDLVSGYMGILEPDRRKSSVIKALDMPDCIVVPGVAFDSNLNRIGYGAGFYDTYLSEHGYTDNSIKPCLIGICYDFQMSYDIEADVNDIKMNIVVTENGVYR